jgi:hypothetical protein
MRARITLGLTLAVLAGNACGQAGDPCAGVVCDQPPADRCQDAGSLLEFAAAGVCEPATGRCEYAATSRTCLGGCQAGRCLEEPVVWGWVSLLELNDATLNAPWTWLGGVRAYFAQAPHCRVFPEHWLETCGPPLAEEGACRLYGRDWQDPWRCDPACDLEAQECVDVDGQPVCLELPGSWDVGTLQIAGLSAPLVLSADAAGRYAASQAPADLFGAGDAVSLNTGGGQLVPFSLQGHGVAHLEIGSSEVALARGQPAQVTWTPADPGSRIQVLLSAGPHHPAPPVAAILCDAPDEDARLDIPAALVTAFRARAYCVCRFSHITRYRRTVETPYQGRIELTLGSVRLLQLQWR